MAARSGTTIDVEGRTLRVSNLDKVLFPATGTTKGDVLEYYLAVAHVLVPHATDRPVTRKRWVHGVGSAQEPGEVFFQKNLEQSAPSWVHRAELAHRDHTNTYPVLEEHDGAATLAWFAQLAALEVHVPQWRLALDRPGARGAPPVHHPDRLVLDLDPGPGAGLPECVEVARLCRAIVGGMGLELVPVTSGSKGIHLYAGLDGALPVAEVSAVAHELARALEADHPDLVVSDMKKSLREGRVLVDWSQNSGNKTTVAPYSLRGRELPRVAAPRTWDELDENLDHLGPAEVIERVRRIGDPMAHLAPGGARGAGGAGAAEEARAGDDGAAVRADDDAGEGSGTSRTGGPAAGEPGARDRLEVYRSKRSADRTPEPVPAAPAGRTPGADADAPQRAGDTFVIQDHHASRHHHDFRLEHDGVLLSWALPRLTPAEPSRNHLAVRTEDHPLEYGSFEGTIPRGEYGAGTVSIWDAGTYEAEKLRDDEIIVVLHGRPDGGLVNDGGPQPPTFALIRTEGTQWLIHRMDLRKHLSSLRRRGLVPGQTREDRAAAGASPASGDEGAGDGGAAQPAGKTRARAGGHDATGPAHATPAGERDVVVPAPTLPEPAPTLPEPALALPGLAPMLAAPADALARRDLAQAGTASSPWALEMKWDGIRAVVAVDPAAGTLVVRTRGGHDVTASYPELRELLERTHVPAVLDGEIVALDADGAPSFGLLQGRLGLVGERDIARASRQTPVQLVVFDVLHAAGNDLTGAPYTQRREALGLVVEAGGAVQVPDDVGLPLAEALAVSQRLGLEGVLAKRRASPYRPGVRSTDWLKIKHAEHSDVVVVGWRPGQGERAGAIGSLLVAVRDGDDLRYAGRVGSGFAERDLVALGRTVAELEADAPLVEVPVADSRDAHWLSRGLRAEVEHQGWTAGRRLRHPVWRGLRPDLED